MKSTILRASFLVLSATLLASIAGATAACQDTTLDVYIGLGTTGCTIGDKTFSNFAYTPTDKTPLAANVNVAVLGANTLDPGLNFGAFWQVVGTSQDFHLSFTIDVAPGGNLIKDNSLGIQLSTITGAGFLSVGETVCLGGNFQDPNAGTFCGGTEESLLDVFGAASSHQLSDHSIPFVSGPYGHVQVFKDIGLHASGTDIASFSSVSQHFSETSAVPEPVTFSLMGVGLLGIGLLRKRIG